MTRRVWRVGLAAALALSTTGPLPLILPAQAQAPAPAAGAAPDFVDVPAGPFTMGASPGATPDAFDNERWPGATGTGRVDLPLFAIARREVTVAEFSAFAAATRWTADSQALQGPGAMPVRHVAWTDAVRYARWLTAALAADPSTPPALKTRLAAGWRVTLPSEAQWEKAARGTDQRQYPWGDTPRRDRATFGGDGPTAAGSRPCPECAHGLEDMAGNVWEWTRSPYQPYPFDDADDRAGLDADALWVMRGGGFADPARLVRTTARGAAEPGARRPFIGFRVALVPPRP